MKLKLSIPSSVAFAFACAIACARSEGAPGADDVADAGPDARDDVPSFGDVKSNDCNGATCAPNEACVDGGCMNACDAAKVQQSSVGCDYFATYMDAGRSGADSCFAVFVANTWATPVHIAASFSGNAIDLGKFAVIPQGSGKTLAYAPYDPKAGLPAGQVAILFLGDSNQPKADWVYKCPAPVDAAVPAAVQDTVASVAGTGRGHAFHVQTDVPVVSYQILPYGGGHAAVTGATLLTPTSAWDTNYIAMSPAPLLVEAFGKPASPSLDIVAAEDGTHVTILPKVAIVGGSGVQGSAANKPVSYDLNAGEMLQITQPEELTGSPIQSDKPIGFWGGHQCLIVPAGLPFFCDHAEQQFPPVRALGSEYASASYRPRTSKPENVLWRIVGVVGGTTLAYDPAIPGAPTSVSQGGIAEFHTDTPFVVKSQDAKHPFILTTYMSGAGEVDVGTSLGYGDPDWVRMVTPAQYLNRYVFFTDPTYPETNLVVIRRAGTNGFADVTLDCAGTLSGWQPIGSGGVYEFTRIDLVRHDYAPQGNCDNGRHEMSSSGRFGLWVWGWGSNETTGPRATTYVSYGYPAGETIAPINTVVVPPTPN